MPYRPKNYITGSITTVDGTLVQETVTVPFPAIRVDRYGQPYASQHVLHLKNLTMEIGAVAGMLEATGDEFTVTITPNTETTHPTIDENDCLFKHTEQFHFSDEGVATDHLLIAKVMYLIKKFTLKDCYIMKPQFYIQVTLDGTATTIKYKIEYEITTVSSGQASYERGRRNYTQT